MGNGLKITGLVLGIASCVLWWVPFVVFAALPMAIVALVLSIMGNKKQKSGLGTAALIVSIIGLVLSGIGFITCGICTTCALCAAGTSGGCADLFNGLDFDLNLLFNLFR